MFEFDPNWLKADLVIHNLTIFTSLAFQDFSTMGGTILVAMCRWKKSHFTLAQIFETLKTQNTGSKHQQTSTNNNISQSASESIGPINQWVSFCPSFRRFRGLLKEGAFAKRNDSSNSWGDVSGKFNDSMDVKAKSKPVHKCSNFKKELGKTGQFRFICALHNRTFLWHGDLEMQFKSPANIATVSKTEPSNSNSKIQWDLWLVLFFQFEGQENSN